MRSLDTVWIRGLLGGGVLACVAAIVLLGGCTPPGPELPGTGRAYRMSLGPKDTLQTLHCRLADFVRRAPIAAERRCLR